MCVELSKPREHEPRRDWLSNVEPPEEITGEGDAGRGFRWGTDLDKALDGLNDPAVQAALTLARNGGIAVLPIFRGDAACPLGALFRSDGYDEWAILSSAASEESDSPAVGYWAEQITWRLTPSSETHTTPLWTIRIAFGA